MKNKKLFLASVVGSLPRPKELTKKILSTKNVFSNYINQQVKFVIAAQEKIGLDVITDGEWRRKSYVGVVEKIIDGLVCESNKDTGQTFHTVVKKIKYKNPGYFAREAKFLKQNTSKQIKICLPSPYLLGERLWNEEKSSKAYPKRKDFVEDIIKIFQKEIKLLENAGTDIVQIDDPHICLFVDKKTRALYKNPDKELEYACQVINKTLEKTKKIKTALHLCRRNKGRCGWIGEGGYEYIIPFINKINVNQLVMEYSLPVAGDFKALEKLNKKFEIGLGCVDCRFEKIESPKVIVERVRKALQYVDPQRISLNPDCGFAPGSHVEIPLIEAINKLSNEVKAREILRKEYEK